MIDQVLCMHNGKPQWRNAGNWGLLTWDHGLPGVIIGTKMFVLRLSPDYGSYPTSGTAEIQFRDYTDRVNHTFATYAKLDQIAADGNLGQDAYIFTDGQYLYYTAIVSWFTPPNGGPWQGYYTPTKTVLYRLDSVDSSKIGSFTLLGSTTMDTAMNGNIQFQINSHGTATWSENNYQFQTEMYPFNGTLDTSNRVTYTDDKWPGGYAAMVNEVVAGDLFLIPYSTSLSSRKVRSVETYTPRAVKTWWWSNGYVSYWYDTVGWPLSQTGVFEGMGIGYTGADASPSDFYWMGSVIVNGMVPWRNGSSGDLSGLVFCHPVSFSNNWNKDYAEVFGLVSIYNNWNNHTGDGSATTSSYVLNHASDTAELVTFPTYSPSSYGGIKDKMTGIWGHVGAVVWQTAAAQNRASSAPYKIGVLYTDYYVIRGDDTTNANRYSIFSGVEGDGEIIHIEGLEDPTPTLWVDNTFVGNLN